MIITAFSAEAPRSSAQALHALASEFRGVRVFESAANNAAEIHVDGEHAQYLLTRAMLAAPLTVRRLAMSLETTEHASPDIAESVVGHASSVANGSVIVFGRSQERIIASVIFSDERLIQRALRAWVNRTTMYAVEEAFMASLLPHFDEAPWERLRWRSYYALVAETSEPPDVVTATTIKGATVAVVRRSGKRIAEGAPSLDDACVEIVVGDAVVSIASPRAGRWEALIERDGAAKRIIAPNLTILGTNVEAELKPRKPSERLQSAA